MDTYYYNIADLLDIEKGETIILSSNLSLLMYQTAKQGIDFNFNKLIDSFISRIGCNGNILLPAYNWDFCGGKTFNYNETLSTTGVLANEAMKRNDFTRTKHPVNSHFVWGKDKDKLTSTDYMSSYGATSIFTELYSYNIKYVFLGVNLTAFTYLHHFEQEIGVPYRYLKYFTGSYIDRDSSLNNKTYSVYVRRLEDQPNYHLKDMSSILLQNNAGKEFIYNKIPYYVYDVSKCKQYFYQDILNNHSYTYMKFKDGYNPEYQTKNYIHEFAKNNAHKTDLFNILKNEFFGELVIDNTNNFSEVFISGKNKNIKHLEYDIKDSVSKLENAIIEINDLYNIINKDVSYKISLI